MHKSILPLFAVLSFAVPATARHVPTEADLRGHIEILASDRFQGREPGTIGESIASHYVAAQFAQRGLEPGVDGSYYQRVPLVRRSMISANARWNGVELSSDDILLIGRDNQNSIDAPVVFGGYGRALTESDVSGAAVLLLTETPPGDSEMPRYATRRNEVARLGPAAIIGINMDDARWEMIGQRFANNQRARLNSSVTAAIEGLISAAALVDLLGSDGNQIARLRNVAQDPGFRSFILDARLEAETVSQQDTFVGYNVVARLAGTGETDESVLFLAHYDHLGICQPEGLVDRICNGAVDNASGVAAIIEIAHALSSESPHARDIVFIATTAEEQGLLGAHYYAENPTVPLDGVIAALNLDTIAIGPADTPVGIVGRGLTPLDTVVDAVARELGRDNFESTSPNAFVRRQDGWALTSHGVDAIMVGGSFVDIEALTEFLGGTYHTQDDDVSDSMVLSGAYEDTLLHIALGRAFADPDRYSAPAR